MDESTDRAADGWQNAEMKGAEECGGGEPHVKAERQGGGTSKARALISDWLLSVHCDWLEWEKRGMLHQGRIQMEGMKRGMKG